MITPKTIGGAVRQGEGDLWLVDINSEAAALNAIRIVYWNIAAAGPKAEGERSMAEAPARLRRRPAVLCRLTTHKSPLSQIDRAFGTAEKRLGVEIKVAVIPTAGEPR